MSLFPAIESLGMKHQGNAAQAAYAQEQSSLLQTQNMQMHNENVAEATRQNIDMLTNLVEVGEGLRIPDLTQEFTAELRRLPRLENIRGYCAPFSWMAHPDTLARQPADRDGIRVMHGWNLRWTTSSPNISEQKDTIPSMSVILFQGMHDDVPTEPRLTAPLHELADGQPMLDEIIAQDSSLSLKYWELLGREVDLDAMSFPDLNRYLAELRTLAATTAFSNISPNFERRAFAENMAGQIALDNAADEAGRREKAPFHVSYNRVCMGRIKREFGSTFIAPEALLKSCEGVPGPILESSFTLPAIRALFTVPTIRRNRLGRDKQIAGGAVGNQSWPAEPSVTGAETDRSLIAERMGARYLPYLQKIIAGD